MKRHKDVLFSSNGNLLPVSGSLQRTSEGATNAARWCIRVWSFRFGRGFLESIQAPEKTTLLLRSPNREQEKELAVWRIRPKVLLEPGGLIAVRSSFFGVAASG